MFEGGEDSGRVVDADGRILRSVQDQNVDVAEAFQVFEMVESFEIVEKPSADHEGPTGQFHFCFASVPDFVDPGTEKFRHMGRVRRRTDCRDGADPRDLVRRSQDGRSAQGVADQELGSGEVVAKPASRPHEIVEIG